MATQKFTITIDSILGGISPTTNFSAPDQFMGSIGINPSLPQGDMTFGITPTTASSKPSGLLRPGPIRTISLVSNDPPLWLRTPRGTTVTYMLGNGSTTYTIDQSGGSGTLSILADGGALASMSNGSMEYYDNYLYYTKNTDIARYGPLNGTPSFDGSFWVTTLGLTSLSNITFPVLQRNLTTFNGIPQHQMLRHSDGKLYIADTIDNQGVLHYIKTTKTTIEGDTNNGSKYDAVRVGYGLVITALESYGNFVVLALAERDGAGNYTGRSRSTRAKVAFWDTTSQNINEITWVEFPDNLITAIQNVNGTLYFFSAIQETAFGYRVQRYIGGSSFEEIFRTGAGTPPFPGAVDGVADKLYFGSLTLYPERSGCVHEYNTKFNSIQNIVGTPIASTTVSALTMNGGQEFYANMASDLPLIGWTGSDGHGVSYPVTTNTAYGSSNTMWWSQLQKIGRPFKITKIRIPLAQAVAANMTVTPIVYTDDGAGQTYTTSNTRGLAVINNTNFSGKTAINLRPENLTGNHNFWLELKWTGTALCVVSLPIVIEYEVYDD